MKESSGGKGRRFRDLLKLSHRERDASPSHESPARAHETSPSRGIIKFETGKLPAEFASFKEKRKSNRPGGVVILIAALALIFIAIIAWFIAHEPPK